MEENDLVRDVQKIMNGEIGQDFMITQDGMLVMKGKVCVPNVNDLRKVIAITVSRLTWMTTKINGVATDLFCTDMIDHPKRFIFL